MPVEPTEQVGEPVKISRVTVDKIATGPIITKDDDLHFSRKDAEMETSVPVLPVTHPAGYGGYGSARRGLEGKDAAFLTECHNQHSHLDNIKGVVENRFQTERLGRDLAVAQERLERENQKILSEIKEVIRCENKELMAAIVSGNRGVSDTLAAQKAAESAETIADLKLQLALLKK